MKLFYSDGYGDLDFNCFSKLGYNLHSIGANQYDYIIDIQTGDVLFIKLDDIDIINQLINPTLKITIFLFISHEYCNEHRRIDIVKNKNHNHSIWFLTSHIDFYSIDNDMSLESKMFPFKEAFSDKAYINPINRNIKYNFFNRSINLRRLKVFEILKKKNIELLDCYFTFGNIIKHNTFGDIDTIKDFVEFRDKQNKLDIDVEFISAYKNEFKLYENREQVELGIIQSSHSNDMYDTINEQSLDSYVSMIIESSGDMGDDYRLTEKTLRAWLCKNIFLTLQCNGFTKMLNQNGIKTFEDIFGLESDWDDCGEIERIERFVSALDYINTLPKDEVIKIYNSDDIQNRIKHNHSFIMNSFDDRTILNELEKKIGYENNVH
jgi:hypothetical protein